MCGSAVMDRLRLERGVESTDRDVPSPPASSMPVLPAVWRPAVVVLALTLIEAVLATEFATGRERLVVGALVLPILLPAITLSVRWTAVIAMLAVAGSAVLLLVVD